MQKDARFALSMILAHVVVNAVHGAAHRELAIPLSRSQELFVVLVIGIAPILAGMLIWRRFTFGGPLLAASLVGALAFGVWNHFMAVSPDHVSHLPMTATSGWRILFQVSAILLIPTEALGCWAALRLMKSRSSAQGAGR